MVGVSLVAALEVLEVLVPPPVALEPVLFEPVEELPDVLDVLDVLDVPESCVVPPVLVPPVLVPVPLLSSEPVSPPSTHSLID